MSSSLLLETIAQLWYHLTSTHTQTSHFPQHIHTLSLIENNNIVFVKRTSESAAAVGAGAQLDSSISPASVDKLHCSSDSNVSHKRSPVLTLANIQLLLASWINESLSTSVQTVQARQSVTNNFLSLQTCHNWVTHWSHVTQSHRGHNTTVAASVSRDTERGSLADWAQLCPGEVQGEEV